MFSGFYFILLVLFSSYTQRRTLSSSPCCYSFWRKMLHCITMCCWSTSMRSEIHVKDSFPVLIALRPHPAESSLWGTAVGSPKQVVHSWSSNQEQELASCQHRECQKGTLDTDLSLPCSSPKRVFGTAGLRASGLTRTATGCACPVPCPKQADTAKQSLQKPAGALLQLAYKQGCAL